MSDTDTAYALLGRLIGNEIDGMPIEVGPDTVLADIAGWDSVALASVLAEIERETGRPPERERVDRIARASDLRALLDP